MQCCLIYFVTECLLCRRCGHEVVPADFLCNKPSEQALRQRNNTVLDKDEVLIQLFENPHGIFSANLVITIIIHAAQQSVLFFLHDAFLYNFIQECNLR